MAKATGNASGRPRHYDSPEAFTAKVDEYIANCHEQDWPVTWTGLALYLGFSSRQSIDEYLNYDGFSDCVRRAKALVENEYEKRLHGTTPTGAIFALKNFGWRDKQDIDLNATVDQRTITADMDPVEAAKIYAEIVKGTS